MRLAERPTPGSGLRPLHRQRVDFLGADVAAEDRGAIRRNIDLRAFDPIHYSAKALQTGNGLNLTIGESQTLYLGVPAAGPRRRS